MEEDDVRAISEYAEQVQDAAQNGLALYTDGWVCRVWGSYFLVSMRGVLVDK
jgi:hypothetical protein